MDFLILYKKLGQSEGKLEDFISLQYFSKVIQRGGRSWGSPPRTPWRRRYSLAMTPDQPPSGSAWAERASYITLNIPVALIFWHLMLDVASPSNADVVSSKYLNIPPCSAQAEPDGAELRFVLLLTWSCANFKTMGLETCWWYQNEIDWQNIPFDTPLLGSQWWNICKLIPNVIL